MTSASTPAVALGARPAQEPLRLRVSGFNALLGLFLLAVIGAAVVDAWRRRATPVFLLPVLLMASTFVFLAVPDLVAGGRRSVVPRYLVPTYLGVVLTSPRSCRDHRLATIAAAAAGPVQPRRSRRRRSCVIILGWKSAYHWTKGELGRDALRAAAVANNSPRTLLVTDATHGIVLSLSHLLNPAVRLQASDTPESIDVAEGFSTIVLFRTPPALRERRRMHGISSSDESGISGGAFSARNERGRQQVAIGVGKRERLQLVARGPANLLPHHRLGDAVEAAAVEVELDGLFRIAVPDRMKQLADVGDDVELFEQLAAQRFAVRLVRMHFAAGKLPMTFQMGSRLPQRDQETRRPARSPRRPRLPERYSLFAVRCSPIALLF